MPTNDSRAKKIGVIAGRSRRNHQAGTRRQFEVISGEKQRTHMHVNLYRCSIEKNQNGKYNVRVRAQFANGNAQGWTLPVYFLASSFNAAMTKLEQSLQLLQKKEEKLRFWTVERSDDPNFAGDLLQESGLRLDHRRDFPRKSGEISIRQERSVPAALLGPLRRVLADSVAEERVSTLAGD